MTVPPAPAAGRALVDSLTHDLHAESELLRAVLDDLREQDWSCPTRAEGWTITDQITHLAYFDDVTTRSIIKPDLFTAEAAELVRAGQDFPDRVAARFHDLSPRDVLAWFDRSRALLVSVYETVDPSRRLPWFGPAMSPASSVTARIMETWAHGQDVMDTVGVVREPGARLRHVADIGIRALRYSYTANGLDVPAEPIRVELSAPADQVWTWGPPDAANAVVGDALEFCLVVTQRRHLDDTRLHITGAIAAQWMRIAQSFAGPPGPGRAPLHTASGRPAANGAD